jgi:hypothetical protein
MASFPISGASGSRCSPAAPVRGKTSVVRVFLEGLFGAEGSQPLLLTAPTGKARVRLETKTQRPASTVHQVHHAAGMLGADYRLLRKPTKSTMKYSMGSRCSNSPSCRSDKRPTATRSSRDGAESNGAVCARVAAEFVSFLSEFRVSSCFVHAIRCRFVPSAGHEKTARNGGFLQFFVGAGEGIRTLDPNLGKVVILLACVSTARRPTRCRLSR